LSYFAKCSKHSAKDGLAVGKGFIDDHIWQSAIGKELATKKSFPSATSKVIGKAFVESYVRTQQS